MSLAQMLQQSGAIESMARELGIDEQTARIGAGALLPAIVAGMGRTAAAPSAPSAADPLGGLGGLIGGLGGGGMLDAVLGTKPTPVDQGNDILGAIFGSKDTSRSVANTVSGVTGIDEGLLKKMLPILAMAVAGYLAQQGKSGAGASAGGGLGGVALGGILGSIVTGMMSR